MRRQEDRNRECPGSQLKLAAHWEGGWSSVLSLISLPTFPVNMQLRDRLEWAVTVGRRTNLIGLQVLLQLQHLFQRLGHQCIPLLQELLFGLA